jgi:hypothetical protein
MLSEAAQLYIAETSQILGLLARLMPQAQVAVPSTETLAEAAVQHDRPQAADAAPAPTSLQYAVGGFFQRAAWKSAAPPADPVPVAAPLPAAAPAQVSEAIASAAVAPVPETPAAPSIPQVAPTVSGQGLHKSLSGFFTETSWQGRAQAPVSAEASAVQREVLGEALGGAQTDVLASGTHLTHSLAGFFAGAAWQGRQQQAAAAAPVLAMAGVAQSSAPPDDATDAFFEDIDW